NTARRYLELHFLGLDIDHHQLTFVHRSGDHMRAVRRAINVVRPLAHRHALHSLQRYGIYDIHPGLPADADVDMLAIRCDRDVVRPRSDGHPPDYPEGIAIDYIEDVLALARYVEPGPIRRGHNTMRVGGYQYLAGHAVGCRVDHADLVVVA